MKVFLGKSDSMYYALYTENATITTMASLLKLYYNTDDRAASLTTGGDITDLGASLRNTIRNGNKREGVISRAMRDNRVAHSFLFCETEWKIMMFRNDEIIRIPIDFLLVGTEHKEEAHP